ncbi:hypothetical protein HYW76_05145 [Candidatus Pacearchaeota archaeon]|nr:hypothetical protein [Candidatus Pacearchaeota archaeon]
MSGNITPKCPETGSECCGNSARCDCLDYQVERTITDFADWDVYMGDLSQFKNLVESLKGERLSKQRLEEVIKKIGGCIRKGSNFYIHAEYPGEGKYDENGMVVKRILGEIGVYSNNHMIRYIVQFK